MKDILLQLRNERDLKQAEVAEKINVVTSAVSKYEIGKNYPEYDTLLKLAEFYDVNLDYLFGRTSIRTPVDTLEAKLKARGGQIPIDFIFRLSEDDKELLRLLLKALAAKPEYNKK